ncbi:Do family serine endopeptidase [Enterobacteriaceae endosymbiont of Donacia tomentosa]|uniref:Do family serine endopeptidase n=1 Tax=Enterobacteriaceae endosymbiont of Donacia tomentosa TaxID=2675787 RepID=UPI001449A05C|nr:Do family serine endopeptidase [Enterobacteriaceae endosymbiont of Donacia tomentosa]QJC31637.1 Do family serine endopeptidase [Enterobacteriaceae endosymbiont of Donacia tomentosa]
MKKLKIIFYLFFFTSIITNTSFKNINAKIIPSVFNTRKGIQTPSLAPILKKVTSAVVNISADSSVFIPNFKIPNSQSKKKHPDEKCHLCKKNFFCENIPCEESNNTLEKKFNVIGSGVIIDAKKGLIVTNNHVIENANNITVELHNGDIYNAKLIGQDIKTDIALIKIEGNIKYLKAIKIANSDNLQVGDYTIAIGNPYGLGETVTSGIISALGRTNPNIENFRNFIQTDASINKGNSGGALINLHGDLIGINTAIFAPSEGNIGIGFAIPSNTVISIVKQILKFGKIKRGSLGFIGMDINPELARIFKFNPSKKGIFINEVLSSPYDSGLEAGDIIISLNGRMIENLTLLEEKINSLPIGTTVKIGVIRKGIFKRIFAKIKDYDNKEISDEAMYSGIQGAYLGNIYLFRNRKIYNYKQIQGIKITKIEKNTPAEKMALKKDDIIFEINQNKINNIKDVRNILNQNPIFLVFHILREKHDFYLLVSF